MSGREQKVVLVTGASAGIGRACADHLERAGWRVFGASRRGTGSGGWAPLVVDVDDDGSVSAGVDQVIERAGRLDAVVAAAGWGLAGPVEETSLADAHDQFETNFFGVVRVVQAALPIMRAQGGGRLVLISSIGGEVGIPFQAFYSASKFALEGFGEALEYEVAPFGVHVSLIQPGNFVTDFTANRRDAETVADSPYRASAERALAKMVADERAGASPEDAADLVVRVLAARRPPRRRTVGKVGERVGPMAKRLLPGRLFEAGASSSLGV